MIVEDQTTDDFQPNCGGLFTTGERVTLCGSKKACAARFGQLWL